MAAVAVELTPTGRVQVTLAQRGNRSRWELDRVLAEELWWQLGQIVVPEMIEPD